MPVTERRRLTLGARATRVMGGRADNALPLQARVKEAVVADPCGREVGHFLLLDLALDHGPHSRVGLLVVLPALRPGLGHGF